MNAPERASASPAAPSVSAEVPDWSREAKGFFEWAPSRSLLAAIRSYQRHAGRRNPWSVLVRRVAVLRHRFWSVVTGAEVPLDLTIGGGLLLPHPNGVVIHSECVIGPNCLLFQQVTLGAGHGGVPTLGGHVDIGAGAKVLGKFHVGDHVRISANSLVTCAVPSGGVVSARPSEVRG